MSTSWLETKLLFLQTVTTKVVVPVPRQVCLQPDLLTLSIENSTVEPEANEEEVRESVATKVSPSLVQVTDETSVPVGLQASTDGQARIQAGLSTRTLQSLGIGFSEINVTVYVTSFPFINSAGVMLALLNVFDSVGVIVMPELAYSICSPSELQVTMVKLEDVLVVGGFFMLPT